jgi:uncharacterized membrane protein YsdA (DUF1294 family)
MWYAAVAYLGLVAVTSLASFAAYGLDKRRAGIGGRRVPERTLHLLALLGGWPGAILGQRQFRHKTRKVPFQIAFWAVVVLHVALVGAVAYTLLGSYSGHPKPIKPCVASRVTNFANGNNSPSAVNGLIQKFVRHDVCAIADAGCRSAGSN